MILQPEFFLCLERSNSRTTWSEDAASSKPLPWGAPDSVDGVAPSGEGLRALGLGVMASGSKWSETR